MYLVSTCTSSLVDSDKDTLSASCSGFRNASCSTCESDVGVFLTPSSSAGAPSVSSPNDKLPSCDPSTCRAPQESGVELSGPTSEDSDDDQGLVVPPQSRRCLLVSDDDNDCNLLAAGQLQREGEGISDESPLSK